MQLYIYFLGTGGSWPTVQRNVSAVAIKRGGEIILFDCGEGTQRQLQKSKISYMQIKKIFITHYHGDHFLGLPGLIQTFQLNDREEPLYVYGPKGIGKIVSDVIHLGYFKPSYDIFAYEMKPGDEIKFEGYKIKCIDVCHNVPTLAYCLEEDIRPGRFNKKKALELGIPEGPLFRKLQNGESVNMNGKIITPEMVLGPPRPGRKVTISGDTMPCEKLVKFAKGSDVLIHDATFDSSLEERAIEYGHSTARQAAEIAKRAEVEKLILTHISPRYKDAKLLEEEAREIFPNTWVAHDFMELEVRLKK
ncbi:ribonuclease Z [Thermoplasmatales archaeon ex4484_30]|nr:MAG: ribonuclease Z [Thermoplasmata archaeon]OYT61807.1 MAG: ribonuclease Z [Thermoplasmatales archaeon ex4484_30]